jgi:hypothetical protein
MRERGSLREQELVSDRNERVGQRERERERERGRERESKKKSSRGKKESE